MSEWKDHVRYLLDGGDRYHHDPHGCFRGIVTARRLAEVAHAGQPRKYTGEPYVTHPIAVARLIVDHGELQPDASIIDQQLLTILVCTALLHDVVEDSALSVADVASLLATYGPPVGDRRFVSCIGGVPELVGEITELPKVAGQNRAARKLAYAQQIASAHWWTQIVKVADLVHNTLSIEAHEPGFWKTYRVEKRDALDLIEESKSWRFDRWRANRSHDRIGDGLMAMARAQIGGNDERL